MNTAILTKIPKSWSGPQHLLETNTENGPTRTEEQYPLIFNNQESWQNWGSHPNKDTNPQRNTRSERKKNWTQKGTENPDLNYLSGLILDRHTSDRNWKTVIKRHFVDYLDIFARHKMDIGMNTEFKSKLIPKDDKYVYSQNLPVPNLPEKTWLFSFLFCTFVGSLPCYQCPSTQVPFLHKENQTEILVDIRKINNLIPDVCTNKNHPVSTLQMQHKTWQRDLYSASSIAPRLITVCRWLTKGQWKCFHSFFLAEILPTEDLHKVLAALCLLFKVSCASFRTQMSKLTGMPKTWTILELQPKLIRILPGTYGPVFKCNRQVGLKLTIEKCLFGVKKVEFLSKTISSDGVSPQSHKTQTFFYKLRFSTSKKIVAVPGVHEL